MRDYNAGYGYGGAARLGGAGWSAKYVDLAHWITYGELPVGHVVNARIFCCGWEAGRREYREVKA